jgi:GNAT superfamily N-acetyltransferase
MTPRRPPCDKVFIVTTDLILVRAVTAPIEPPSLPPDCSIIHITNPAHRDFTALDHFCLHHGFPPGWPAQMIANSASVVMIAQENVPLAAGWLTRKPFYISEIRQTFFAGDDADYYFGDWVDPNSRGQGLQRALIAARLQQSQIAHRTWALTLTRTDIPASLTNYRTCGFQVSARWRALKILKWEFGHKHRVDLTLPSGSLTRTKTSASHS